MIALDRMALADVGPHPARLAREVIAQIEGSHGKVPLPIPVDEIAIGAGIVEIKRVESAAFEGILVQDDAKQAGVIAVNRRSSPERARFTVSHELGHFLHPLHEGGQFACTKADLVLAVATRDDQRGTREVEANIFAAELLMPERLVAPLLRRRGSPEIGTILSLHRDYGVSKEAASRRFVALQRESCAVVFSREGKVRGLARGAGFPYIGLSRDDRISPTSLTKRFGDLIGKVSEQAEAVPSEWRISSEGGSLWEEVLVQEEGHRLTLLVWEPDDEETREEARSWKPQFR
ncbi:MAG: ImmA/IrrE family metallo-endopeptidase [Burkholderiales bacterium]|jgi:hypothetical protein|nr:ImmA/IrrE family metallo-endopeptidase [Burkholderiales bacterium]